jgi:uncharacterized protein (DUF433 family)
MILEGFPRIAIDPAVCGGRPIIAGTRMRVGDIWEMLAGGGSMAAIVDDFPYLCEEDVREARAFAAMILGHPEQLDYDNLLRRDRQVIRVEDLDDETLEAIRNVEIPKASLALNDLVDEPAQAEARLSGQAEIRALRGTVDWQGDLDPMRRD